MPAARFADIGAGDAQPLVVGRRRQHALQQRTVGDLVLAALAQGAARLGNPSGERVADALQLAKPDQTGLASDGRNFGVEPKPRERLGDQVPQLALEAADLAPQLGAGETLVALYAEPGGTKPDGSMSIEQIRHSSTASLDHVSIAAAAIRRASSIAI